MSEYGEVSAYQLAVYGDDAAQAIFSYSDEAIDVIADFNDDAISAIKNGIEPNVIKQLDEFDVLPSKYDFYNISDGERALEAADKLLDGATFVEHHASSGAMLISDPNKTTTILGRYKKDMENIIDALDYPNCDGMTANNNGFNILNIEQELANAAGERFWEIYNLPFLNEAVERGDDIILATKTIDDYLYNLDGSLSGYGKEYEYMKELVEEGIYEFDSERMLYTKITGE